MAQPAPALLINMSLLTVFKIMCDIFPARLLCSLHGHSQIIVCLPTQRSLIRSPLFPKCLLNDSTWLVERSQQVIDGSDSLHGAWQLLPLLRCSFFSHRIKVGGSRPGAERPFCGLPVSRDSESGSCGCLSLLSAIVLFLCPVFFFPCC